MIGTAAAWRRMLKFWLPGLMLLIVNLGVVSTYRFLLAGQTQMRSSRVERLTSALAQLQAHRQALEEVKGKAEVNRLRVEEFYGRWLSSEADRLTQVIAEVKRMARTSGVRTSGFRYPDEALEEFELIRRSLVFSVEGSYQQLRRFIDSLERSDQFLILEEIGVSDSGGDSSDIRVRMNVSTLFLGAAVSGKA
jgi:type IV pilus assembly protein PilO